MCIGWQCGTSVVHGHGHSRPDVWTSCLSRQAGAQAGAVGGRLTYACAQLWWRVLGCWRGQRPRPWSRQRSPINLFYKYLFIKPAEVARTGSLPPPSVRQQDTRWGRPPCPLESRASKTSSVGTPGEALWNCQGWAGWCPGLKGLERGSRAGVEYSPQGRTCRQRAA